MPEQPSEPLESDRSALNGLISPPPGIYSRLLFYGARYGYVHACLSYIGRHQQSFWRAVGPWVTRPYLRRWLRQPGPRVLNLGGGNVVFERWLTADVDPRSDVYVDITETLPFPGASIDVVYSEEVIEHVDQQVAVQLMSEIYRILKPGGWLRLTTPSLDWFMRRALKDASFVPKINENFYSHGHRYIYSEAALRSLLSHAGFVSLTKSKYRSSDSRFGHFDTHPLRHPNAIAESSQYWEAQKP